MSREVRAVNPFKCRVWDLHDRIDHDSNPRDYRSLLSSIRSQGQKQPALGRYLNDGSEHDIELIYGARRLAAARELGIDLLVEIRAIDDRDALIEMDIENRVRADISAYERGISYKRWLKAGLFRTQSELAKALGVSEAQICRLLRYSELPSVVVGAFESPDDIREEWAATLANLFKDTQLRDGLLRRARSLGNSTIASPQARYDVLVSVNQVRIVPLRPRDEVVKSNTGVPLFRIGFRAKTVHLIMPRGALTQDSLRQISAQVKASLEGDYLESGA